MVAVTYDDEGLDQPVTAPTVAHDSMAIWAKIPAPGAWARQARCVGRDPAIFVAPTNRADVLHAAEACQGCPVKDRVRALRQGCALLGNLGGSAAQ